MIRIKKTGFTLIELIIVLSVIGILSIITHPMYARHMLRVRRSYAAVMLMDISGRMEEYFLLNGSYQDASLGNLNVDDASYKDYYKISIASGKESYKLEAIPVDTQAKDTACGSLLIDQDGNKGVSGSEGVLECWR